MKSVYYFDSLKIRVWGGGGGGGGVKLKIYLPWCEQQKKLDLGPGGLKCLSNQSLFHAIPC